MPVVGISASRVEKCVTGMSKMLPMQAYKSAVQKDSRSKDALIANRRQKRTDS
jgi:hypothetical protein